MLAISALFLACIAAIYLWFVPAMAGIETIATTERPTRFGNANSVTSRVRMLSLIPVLCCLLPLAARNRSTALLLRAVGAVGLLVFVAAAAASIGLFFLPSAILMICSAALVLR
jgi:hypothetical protein